jgi:hypothetical protein
VTIEGAPRTDDLVCAGANAVVAWNRMHDAKASGVVVAVGLSTARGDTQRLADHSAFLRLRHVEHMTRDEVRECLRTAPLELGGFHPSLPPAISAVTNAALRVAAPRLGSTLLVSHVGVLHGPARMTAPAFYPVTGGFGLAIGAATLRGRTVLTLRGRETRHDDEGLGELLALVVEQLERAGGQPS